MTDPPPPRLAEHAADPPTAALDHAHLWHPFTPMRQWRDQPPIVIDRAEGFELIDDQGRRYLDGVSSLWCNVHGHRVPAIDNAIRDQLDKVAHSTLLGLTHRPAAEFAARLVEGVNRFVPSRLSEMAGHTDNCIRKSKLNKVFYSDAGATAVEVAFKMAVGYWHHIGRPQKHKFIGLAGAYHGDTTGTMSVGYSDLFHKPFVSMVFDVTSFPSVDALRQLDPARSPRFHSAGVWPSEDDESQAHLMRRSLSVLREILETQADQTAAICIEPVLQGAAGMVCQPAGFVAAVAKLAREFDVLLILDEVATGFGRTGAMFAFEHDLGIDGFAGPDILCLAKGITGGYLPLAATVSSDRIEQAFTGELHERKTLYHGHTYTGNSLACAAAIASLDLFDQPHGQSPDLIAHTRRSAELIASRLDALRGASNVLDIRQRGLMVGIELGRRDASGRVEPFDFSRQTGKAVCDALRAEGILIRPLGDVVVLMPPPAMGLEQIDELASKTVRMIQRFAD